MLSLDLVQIVTLAFVCTLAAFLALFATARFLQLRSDRRNSGRDSLQDNVEQSPVSFLLLNGQLNNASPSGQKVFETTDADLPDWSRLQQALISRFHDFPSEQPDSETTTLNSTHGDDAGIVEINVAGSVVSVTIHENGPLDAADQHLLLSQNGALDNFRGAAQRAPYPVWATNTENNLIWSNRAYQHLEDAFGAPDQGTLLQTGLPLPRDERQVSARVELSKPDGTREDSRWFDVSVVKSDRVWLHYGTDVTQVIRAEVAQRGFVQTLTKTFALLSIGLAIFSRDRRLTLFNPALIDLTDLSPEFLSGRPDLPSFFDALRDCRIMPEPKDYASWRTALTELADRAAEGKYLETWNLPSGVTYRVIGRPYPNGAIAFLFEDISSEMSISRQFHHVAELGQSVLDSMDEGIALFSRQGRMTMCNAAYTTLWGLGPEGSASDISTKDATIMWQEKTQSSPVWGDARDFAQDLGPRCEWFAEVTMKNGQKLDCRFVPLSGGATLVGFLPRLTPDGADTPPDA